MTPKCGEGEVNLHHVCALLKSALLKRQQRRGNMCVQSVVNGIKSK
jgi:hypothetical protein